MLNDKNLVIVHNENQKQELCWYQL